MRVGVPYREAMTTRIMIVALLALAVTGQAGGADPVDPVQALQASGFVTAVQFNTARATSSVWQVQWRSPRVDLQVLFGNNAQTAAQASQVQEITVMAAGTGLPNPVAERRAVRQAMAALSRLCGLKLSAASDRGITPAGWSALQRTALLPQGKPAACAMPAPAGRSGN